MERESLRKRLEEIEAYHQKLMGEYVSMDQLLQAIGFPCGLASLKEVAHDLLNQNHSESKSEY